MEINSKGRFSPYRTERGSFTLVELLVVVAIIGILAAFGMSQVFAFQQKSNNTSRLSNIQLMQGALEKYYQKNGSYPHVNCGTSVTFMNYGVAGATSLQSFLAPYYPGMQNDPQVSYKSGKYVTKILDDAPTGKTKASGGKGPDNYHMHYIVSGAYDNYQHYMIVDTLERGGSAAILNNPNAIKGGVSRYRNNDVVKDASGNNITGGSINFTSDATWNTCTGDNPSEYWFFDSYTPAPRRTNCGDRLDSNLNNGDHYYILCLGNIAKQPSSPDANDGSLDGSTE